jgi:hypothetical protein
MWFPKVIRPTKFEGGDGARQQGGVSTSLDVGVLGGGGEAARLWCARRGECVFPLDGDLNLPKDSGSHGLRERLAFEVARGSFDEAVLAIETTIGGKLPKRHIYACEGAGGLKRYRARGPRAPWSGVRIANSFETPRPDLEIRPLHGIQPRHGHDGHHGLHVKDLGAVGLDRAREPRCDPVDQEGLTDDGCEATDLDALVSEIIDFELQRLRGGDRGRRLVQHGLGRLTQDLSPTAPARPHKVVRLIGIEG